MLYASTEIAGFDGRAQEPAPWRPSAAERYGVIDDYDDARILLVSSSHARRGQLETILTSGGFSCRHAEGTVEARKLLERDRFELIVLEGRLEGGGATPFCQYLASHVPSPVIIVDTGADVMDRIIALEVGADDYLSHPLHEREVLARARALVRRRRFRVVEGAQPVDAPAIIAPWTLNLISRQLVGPGGKKSVLTPQEQGLLAAFLSRPGKPLTPDMMSESLPDKTVSLIHFRTYIVRLRRKLEKAGFADTTIQTLRYSGYVFDPDVAAAGVVS